MEPARPSKRAVSAKAVPGKTAKATEERGFGPHFLDFSRDYKLG
jgi:hypothetical protein